MKLIPNMSILLNWISMNFSQLGYSVFILERPKYKIEHKKNLRINDFCKFWNWIFFYFFGLDICFYCIKYFENMLDCFNAHTMAELGWMITSWWSWLYKNWMRQHLLFIIHYDIYLAFHLFRIKILDTKIHASN